MKTVLPIVSIQTKLRHVITEFGGNYKTPYDFVTAILLRNTGLIPDEVKEENSSELLHKYLAECIVTDGDMLAVAFRRYSLADFTIYEIFNLCHNIESAVEDLEFNNSEYGVAWEDQVARMKLL
jgi:hypothetical protein